MFGFLRLFSFVYFVLYLLLLLFSSAFVLSRFILVYRFVVLFGGSCFFLFWFLFCSFPKNADLFVHTADLIFNSSA